MAIEVSAQFEGFLAGGAAITLPAELFTSVLPDVTDEAELRVTLYALYAVGRARGQLRGVRASELARETPLVRGLAHLESREGAGALEHGLEAAVARGTLLAVALADGDTLVLVNNEAGRRLLPRLQAGAVEVPGTKVALTAPAAPKARAAQVYEQEIGLLSPSIAEALGRASERWPEEWIVEALQLAAVRNARSWRYAEAILERWEKEGKDDGTTGSAAAHPADRDHGQFDSLIRRS